MNYENVKFKYQFRDYQQRVLNSLQKELEDGRINIVAAPGSGKTVLGLEILRILDRQCIVLVPSVNIRSQWVDRFLQLFVEEEYKSYWASNISIDLNNLKTITVVTYQALYSVFNDKASYICLKNELRNNLYSVCLDEAHHLKNEWWRSIEDLVKTLQNPFIVSLTATPPYDAEKSEWSKYVSLCGSVDCEVLTPEMVKKKALCPYQDHVCLSVPTEEEQQRISTIIAENETQIRALLSGRLLYDLLKKHAVLTHPRTRAELFIEEPQRVNSIISYIKYYGIESAYYFEKNTLQAQKIINNWNVDFVRIARDDNVKPLNGKLLEIFLSMILSEEDNVDKTLFSTFKDELIKNKLLINNRLHINNSYDFIEKAVRNSVSKIDSIKKIVIKEAIALKDRLHLIVLTDNVGKEDLSKVETDEKFTKINCVAIFEELRRMEHLNNLDAYMGSYISYINELAGNKIGLLCGSFTILPQSAVYEMKNKGKPLGNTGYILYEIKDSDRKELVSTVTDILHKGLINILIGTISLLGEGWDAPCVNSVIIASNISSFVQSNQMRGRGLRIDADDNDKVTNIWHLATLKNDINSSSYVISPDYENLQRRFETILGIDMSGKEICNGIERVGLPKRENDNILFTPEFLKTYNEKVFEYAANRKKIQFQWQRLVSMNYDFSIVRDEILLNKNRRQFWNKGKEKLDIYEMRKIAEGLFKTMLETKQISEDCVIRIRDSYEYEKVGVSLDNCSSRDNKLFLKYYEQMIGNLESPRYILCKGIGPWKKYLNIPDYCKTIKSAECLMKNIGFWNSKIIYTRNRDGARFLFELKMKTYSVDRMTLERIRRIVID